MKAKTVGQLIDLLSKHDRDLKIMVPASDHSYSEAEARVIPIVVHPGRDYSEYHGANYMGVGDKIVDALVVY